MECLVVGPYATPIARDARRWHGPPPPCELDDQIPDGGTLPDQSIVSNVMTITYTAI